MAASTDTKSKKSPPAISRFHLSQKNSPNTKNEIEPVTHLGFFFIFSHNHGGDPFPQCSGARQQVAFLCKSSKKPVFLQTIFDDADLSPQS